MRVSIPVILASVALLLLATEVAANPACDIEDDGCPIEKELIDSASAPWGLSFVENWYDEDNQWTVFKYELTSSVDVTHLVIADNCGNDTAPTVAATFYGDDPDAPTHSTTCDVASDIVGYKFPHPHTRDTSNKRTVLLVLSGKVGVAQAEYSIRRQHRYTVSTINGPSCATAAYPDLFPNGGPSGATLECVPNVQYPELDDEQNLSADITISNTRINGKCQNWYTIRRVYTIGSGLLVTKHARDIEIEDHHDPIFSEEPGDVMRQCYEDVPAIANITATAPCGGIVVVDECDEEITSGKCGALEEFRTRTWTAIDSCGNSKCHTQTISILDNEGPEISPKPGSVELECLDSVPGVPNVQATDNCDANIQSKLISSTNITIDGDCRGSRTILRKWSVEDDCGFKDDHEQYIYLPDKTKPYFVFPENYTEVDTKQCEPGPVPDVTGFDECLQESVDAKLFNHTANKTCYYTLTRTWEICDDCGNSNTTSQTINVIDSIFPEWDPLTPAPDRDITVECGDDRIDNPPEQNATDNCLGAIPSQFNDTTTTTNCTNVYDIERQWLITDLCGNTRKRFQTVHVIDETPTYINPDSLPQDIPEFVDCENVPDINDYTPLLTFLDDAGDCDIEANVTDDSDPAGGGSCNHTVTWTWVTRDCSGNEAHNASFSFEVYDGRIPDFFGLPSDNDIEHQCTLDSKKPDAPTVYANDTCTGDLGTVPESDVNNPGERTCYGTYNFTRTWTVDDGCGNVAEYDQLVRVIDDDAPVFDVTAPNRTMTCVEFASYNASGEDVQASDDCNENYNVVPVLVNPDGELIEGDSCNQTYRFEWKVCDDCNNCDSAYQYVYVYDDDAPVILNKPNGTSIDCNDTFIPETVCIKDDCGTVDSWIFKNNIPGSDPINCPQEYTINMTWVAHDECGYEAVHTQLIDVEDNYGPEWDDDLPQNSTEHIECASPDLFTPDALDWSDNCHNGGTAQPTESPSPETICGLATRRRWVWSADDGCGNSIEHILVREMNDTTAPDFGWGPNRDSTPPASYELEQECDDSPPVWPEPEDECSSGAHFAEYLSYRSDPVAAGCTESCKYFQRTVTLDNDANSQYPQCKNATVNYRWNVSDECGLEGEIDLDVRRVDSTPPGFAENITGWPFASMTVQCDEVPPFTNLTPTDDCQTARLIRGDESEDFPINGGKCGRGTITRTWIAEDDCGHQTTHIQLITVIDTKLPTLSGVPNNTIEQCNDRQPPAAACAEDTCGNPELIFSEVEDTAGYCDGEKLITRTYTALDGCGQNVTKQYTVTVQDNTDPEWINPFWEAGNFGGDTQGPVDCSFVIPAAPSADDNCTTIVNTRKENSTTAPSGEPVCPNNKDVEVTYYAKDDCGNEIDKVITWQYRDTDAPSVQSWTDLATNQPIAAANIPGLDTPSNPAVFYCTEPNDVKPTWTDTCSTYTPDSDREDAPTGCDFVYDFTRVWNATDACDNTETHRQYIQMRYNFSLVRWTVTPAAQVNVSCTPATTHIPQASEGAAVDGCGNSLPINVFLKETRYPCSGETVETWVFNTSDKCGTPLQSQQDVYYYDRSAPDIENRDDKWELNECNVDPEDSIPASDTCDSTLTSADIVTDEKRPSTYNDTCLYRFTQYRKWESTDDCGNTATEEQYIHYDWRGQAVTPVFKELDSSDNANDVTIAHNSDLPYVCSPNFVKPNITAFDACGVELEVNFTRTEVYYNCAHDHQYEYKWVTVDDCGIPAEYKFTVTTLDDVPPTVTSPEVNAFSPISASCGDVSVRIPKAVAKDNCPGVGIVFSFADTFHSTDCCNFTRTRTWTARDACGKTGQEHQDVFYRDTTPPEFVDVPDDVVAPCPYEEPVWNVTAREPANAVGYCVDESTSNDAHRTADASCYDAAACASTPPQVSLGGQEFTWATDAFVIVYAVDEILIEGKITAVSDSSLTFDVWVELSNRLDSATAVANAFDCVADSCEDEDDDSKVNKNIWRFYGSIRGGIRGSGANADNDFEFALTANTAGQVGKGASGVNSARNGLSLSVDYSLDNGTDSTALGASGSGEFHIVLLANGVDDTCTIDEDLFPELKCDNRSVTVEQNTPEVNDTCIGTYTITNSWTATDQFGNEVTTDQFIAVYDNTPPSFNVDNQIPLTVNYNCTAPDPTTPLAEDTCSYANVTFLNRTEFQPRCVHDYRDDLLYVAEDDCGNKAYFTQTVVVADNSAPWFLGVPSGPEAQVECDDYDDWIDANKPNITVADDCTKNDWFVANYLTDSGVFPLPQPEVDPIEFNGNTCSENNRYTFKYEVEDQCGEKQSAQWSIKVVDTTAPYVTGTPIDDDISNECVVPTVVDPTFADECSNHTTTLTQDENNDPQIVWLNIGVCDYEFNFTRVWTAIDDCGNTNTTSQFVRIYDDEAPLFNMSTVPDNVTDATCEDPRLEDPPLPEANDNCASENEVSVILLSKTETPPANSQARADCPYRYRLTRVWQACDTCGNCNTVEQNIDVDDLTPPTIKASGSDTLPQNSTSSVTCGAIPETEPICVEDGCAGVDLDVSIWEDPLPQARTCPYRYRIWTRYYAADECGNDVEHRYYVDVDDQDDPEWIDSSLPNRTITLKCTDDVPDYTLRANDTCSGDLSTTTPEWESQPQDLDSFGCSFTYDRVWVLCDECQHCINFTQTVNVINDITPQFEEFPDNITDAISCDEVDQIADGFVNASHPCVDNVSVHGPTVENSSWPNADECVGRYVIERTWFITDDCGNNDTRTQYIYVDDSEAPDIDPVTPFVDVQCDEDIPTTRINYTDNCDDTLGDDYRLPASEWNDSSVSNCLVEYDVHRHWEVYDDCGNQANASQIVRVRNDRNVTISPKPGSEVVNCTDIPPRPNLTASHDCFDSIELTVVPEFTRSTAPIGYPSCDGNYEIVWQWTATDNCGHSDDHEIVIGVVDTKGPEWVNPEDLPDNSEDLLLNCTDDVPVVPEIFARDNCENVTVTYVQTNSSFGLCGTTIFRTWDVCDSCDHCLHHNQTIHIDDRNPPFLPELSPKNASYECGSYPDREFPEPWDDCTDIDQNDVDFDEWEVPNPNGCPNEKTIHRSYCVSDACGHRTCKNESFDIVDTTAPSILFEPPLPADCTEYECVTEWPPMEVDDDNVDIVEENDVKVCLAKTFRNSIFSVDGNCQTGAQGKTHAVWLKGIQFDVDTISNRKKAVRAKFDTPGVFERIKIDDETTGSISGLLSLYNYANDVDTGLRLRLQANFFEYSRPEVQSDLVSDSLGTSPHAELRSSKCAYDTTTRGLPYVEDGADGLKTIRVLNWEYFSYFNGTITGVGALAGVEFTLTRRGPSLQIGIGANDKTLEYGLSEWFSWTLKDGSAAILAANDINVLESKHHVGDFNMDLDCEGDDVDPVSEPECVDEVRTVITNRTEPGNCTQEFDFIKYWEVFDCSNNSQVYNRTFKIRDNIAPTFMNVPSTLLIRNCGDELPTPEDLDIYTVDTCECDDDSAQGYATTCTPIYSWNETVIQTCDGNYTVLVHLSTMDSCGNNNSAVYGVRFEDELKPNFTNTPPPTLELQCYEEVPEYDMKANDNCGGYVNVELIENTTTPNGDCDAEFEVYRVWEATDNCTLSRRFEQTIQFNDTIPPLEIPHDPLCLLRSTGVSDASFELYTQASVNGRILEADDNCSDVTITITGCSSNQDIDFGTPVRADGFTDHCFVDSNDVLKVSTRALTVPADAARVYTVVGYGEDQCGNRVDLERELVVIGQEVPDKYSNLECPAATFPCTGDCPCEYNDQQCEEVNGAAVFSSAASFDPVTEWTWFTYSRLTANGESSLSIALDLGRLQVVDTIPAATVGRREGSFFEGVTFAVTAAVSEYKIAVSGDWTSTTDNIPAQATTGAGCITFDVTGPCGSTAVAAQSGETVTGRVGVAGTLGNKKSSFLYGLGAVNVLLLDSNKLEVSSTYTDESGAYTFNGVAAGSYFVVAGEGGVLSSPAGYYLSSGAFDPTGTYPHGDPVAVTAGVNTAGANDLVLYINKFRLLYSFPPEYNRVRDGALFNGNPKSANFWSVQFSLFHGEATGTSQVPSVTLGQYAAAADSQLSAAGCSSSLSTDTNDFRSSATHKTSAVAVVLNDVAGRGILEPYSGLQDLLIQHALSIVCSSNATTEDESDAGDMLQTILSSY